MASTGTMRLITAQATVITTEGIFQTTALILPHTGLGLTPACVIRVCRRAADERWTLTHLATGKAIAVNIAYDYARRLIRAMAALPIDWRGEKLVGSPEAIQDAKSLARQANL